MIHQLNKEQLKIYHSYGGDMDGIYRNNRATELAVFGNELNTTWVFIASKLHDMELIAKQQTSFEYCKQTLTELLEKTDTETYNLFTEKIPFYADFQQVKQILETIKVFTTDESDTVWAGYDNGKSFLIDLHNDITNIAFCNFETLDKLNLEFAPTSTYQEISLSNGWANEFLNLAQQFDNLYEKIKK